MSFKASTVDYDFLSKKVWSLQKMNGLLFVNTQLGFHRDINSSSCRHNFEKDIVLEKFETMSPKQNGKP